MSPKNPNYKTQTNEGAVRYLIKEKETPDCILALCSETVRKKAVVEMPDGRTCTTLEYFRDALRRVGIPAERLVVIEVPDSMDDEKKQFQAISQLLDKIEKEDTLSIDLSGGMRDTAMLLVTAARCMRDLRGVQTRRVIYAELRGEEPVAHDRTQLYDLFDFVTAMDEFFSTGTAQKLKSYLWSEGEKDPVLHTLLTRINQFSEDLALCRVRKLNDDLNQIAQALKEMPKKSQNLTDLFFRLLKDRFSTEFAELLTSGEKALPALVSWCAKHGMYQQALTLLCEQMPAYVCRHLFVQPTETGWAYLAAQNQNKGKAWVYPLFHFHFCRLTLMQKEYPYTTDLRLTHSKDDAEGNMLFGVANSKEMHAYMDTVLASGQLVIDPDVRWQIEDAALFYQRVMQYRNQINHASDTAFGLQSDRILPLDTAHIEQTLQDVADYLQEIRPMKPDVPKGVKALPVTKTIPAGAAPNL
ncbi:TM1812 family CRISPR-associated protein [Faecalibacterium prausnitzii]|uniref:TM1812 family CRISPR-associated protein n=1 Tax=Faecalibacterium prausnitzii TaxID=853 RepID=UPI003A811B00